MTVHCPHCMTAFVLPEQLLGPGGARVRCPRCSGQFEVARRPPSAEGSPTEREAAGTSPGASVSVPAAEARRPHVAPAPVSEDRRTRVPAFRPPEPAVTPPESAATGDAATADDLRRLFAPPTARAAGDFENRPAAVPAAPVDARRDAAIAVLEELESAAPWIGEAWSRGRLFAEVGPQLLDAFDEYCDRLGPGADPVQFRSALRERWGITLVVESASSASPWEPDES